MSEQGNNSEQVKVSSIKKKESSFFMKLAGTFLDIPDGRSVKEYLIKDCLVPGIGHAAIDLISMMFLGQPVNRKNTGGGTTIRMSYNQPQQTNYSIRRSNAASVSYDSICVDSKAVADEIIARCRRKVSSGSCSLRDYYGTVNDVCGYAGLDITDPNLTRYGWTNLQNAYAKRRASENDWEIVMPSLQQI